jgi:hypothetical protein
MLVGVFPRTIYRGIFRKLIPGVCAKMAGGVLFPAKKGGGTAKMAGVFDENLELLKKIKTPLRTIVLIKS